MHSIQEIRAEYDRLDQFLGVDTSDIEIVISQRSIKRLGSCRYPRKGSDAPLRITISAQLLDEDDQFWDTVRHEYAHAAAYLMHPGESHGHDAVWKEICRRIGCTPKSTAQVTEELARSRRENAKYMVRCNGCGTETYYLRAGKIVSLMERGYRKRIRCSRCGSNDLSLYERG